MPGFAGGLLGVLQGFMPPDAFTFDTSGQLVMQTAIGGVGTLFGPLVGAARLAVPAATSCRAALGLGAAWKLVLGLVFVLLVCFLRHGIIGGLERSLRARVRHAPTSTAEPAGGSAGADCRAAAAPVAPMRAAPARAATATTRADPAGHAASPSATAACVANSNIDFTVKHGELRGIIGPNGAGKSTFFKMLTCEVPPTSGTIVFEGHDITGKSVTDVCQLGLTKSYQVNQLFTQLTVRENLTIAALAELRGKFRLDLFRTPANDPGPRRAGRAHAASWCD